MPVAPPGLAFSILVRSLAFGVVKVHLRAFLVPAELPRQLLMAKVKFWLATTVPFVEAFSLSGEMS